VEIRIHSTSQPSLCNNSFQLHFILNSLLMPILSSCAAHRCFILLASSGISHLQPCTSLSSAAPVSHGCKEAFARHCHVKAALHSIKAARYLLHMQNHVATLPPVVWHRVTFLTHNSKTHPHRSKGRSSLHRNNFMSRFFTMSLLHRTMIDIE
jgi:hypothetical protein